jgi:Obg family GTPase CgtA-like protein
VEREGDGWRVTGGQIESFAARTNWAERDAVERIRDILRKRGVMRELSRQGIERGDMIRIGTNELEWRD